jgi:uncharacterized GH25 family protein
MRRAARFLSVALLLVAARTAAAHDFWAEPGSHTPKAAEPLVIRLRVGDHFVGEEFPRSKRHCERFEVLDPAGTALPVAGEDQKLPAGTVTLATPGLHWIVYRSRDSTTDVPPAIFVGYLESEGLTSHLAEWKALDPEGKHPVREAFSRCAKTLVNVTGDAKAVGFDRVAGLKLEIVPEANPLALKPGDELSVLVRWDGKPLADQQVSALSIAEPKKPMKARTDKDGRARLKLDRAGVWMLKAVHLVRATADEPVQFRSTWATLTFDLPEPPPPPSEAASGTAAR